VPKPDDVGVGTALLVLNEKKQLLLGKRKGAHCAGTWCCPGGWMDRTDKTSSEAVIREAAEECGIEVQFAEPFIWTTEDHEELGVRTVTLYHTAISGDWTGTPAILEPEKCDGWEWFDLDTIPDQLFPGLRETIAALRELEASL